MKKCNYCGRIYKESYESCPGCNAYEFTEMANSKMVIKTPPKDGYKINFYNYKKRRKKSIIFLLVGIVCLFLSSLMLILFWNFFSLAISKLIPFLIFVSLIFIPFVVYGCMGLKKINVIIKKKEKLKTNGFLIKNLNYEVEQVGFMFRKKVYFINVIYENEKGVKIPLSSEAKYDGQLSRADGTVDLLIDPNDLSNYYIDFEIYKKTNLGFLFFFCML